MAGSTRKVEVFEISTTDNTEQNAFVYTVPDNVLVFIEWRVICIQDDGTDYAYYRSFFCGQRDGGSLLDRSGSPTVESNESSGLLDASSGTNVNDFELRVTGLGSSNFTWRGWAEIIEVNE